MISDRDWLRVGAPVTVEAIIARVAERYGLRPAHIIGHVRVAALVGPRHLAMWLCCHLTRCSLPEIAEGFGDRHHTTVLHARQKLDHSHARGKLAAPDLVWRSLISGEDEGMAA